MPIDASSTLGDLVTEDLRRSRVLEGFGIDYCCHGDRSLADATAEAGLDLEEVRGALDLPGDAPAVATGPLKNGALAHDIVDTHHAYLWEEMPRLQKLVDLVAKVHGQNHPELEQLREAYTTAVAGLDPHMTREERIVFPAISKLEKAQAPVRFSFGTLAEPIAQLVREHDVVGDLFKQMRSLTDGYAVPDDACASYRAMLQALEEMELDLHEHVHKENNVLFPQALEMEERVSAG